VSSVRIIDNLPVFKRHLSDVLDDALREVSRDILIKARIITPYRAGPLRSNSNNRRIKQHHHRVEFNQEYAIYQERPRKTFKYTTPGTKPHYLESTGDKYTRMSLAGTFKKHAGRARV
jgi:hypothetical protein